jgi:hypothetical protein
MSGGHGLPVTTARKGSPHQIPRFLSANEGDQIMDDPTPEQVYSAASNFVAAKISVIPIGKEKKPARLDGRTHLEWKPYQSRLATDSELRDWYLSGRRFGIGVVLGKVSGNVQVLDIEARAAYLLFQILEELDEHCPGLSERLPIIKSASGGYHIPHRCEQVSGNRKLAVRVKLNAEGKPILDEHGKPQTDLLIEVKGEGGYVVTCALSPGGQAL